MTRISGSFLNSVSNEVFENRNKLNEKDGEYKFGEKMYEAGMTSVIKEMASKKFMDIIGSPGEIMESRREASRLYCELSEVLNEDQQRILFNMFDALETSMACAEEHRFVEGYLTGYKYVKELG